MKLLFFIALLAIAPAAAFVPASFARPSFALAARTDSAAAVAAALEASKKFGATSPEARVAWDVVEEIDASDNSAASMGSLDTECLLTEGEISNACLDYSGKLNSLHEILGQYTPKLDALKSLTAEMESIKMTVAKSQVGSDSPQVRAALEHAKAVSAEKGASSPDAKIAWAELEEIASSGTGNAMGTRLDEECLVESAKSACLALEELERVMALARSKADNMAAF